MFAVMVAVVIVFFFPASTGQQTLHHVRPVAMDPAKDNK